MLTVRPVRSDSELDQIAQLSRANLVTEISPETRAREGFVTWVYTPPILRALHRIAPSVVAMDGDTLAGYAITLTAACESVYPVMSDMVQRMRTVMYEGRPLSDYRYYIMGQICVAAPYRGQGVVQRLYTGHREIYGQTYDLLVTEISTANPRSSKAHAKVGFEVVETFSGPVQDWDMVVWDWRQQKAGGERKTGDR